MTAREADEGLYVAAGEVTEQARQFAASHRIRLIHGAELARWAPVPRAARLRSAH
jgi:restriction endonuclease Mrr